jgi:hypothetical protein
MRPSEITNMEKKASIGRVKKEREEAFNRKMKLNLEQISQKRVAGFFGDCVSSNGINLGKRRIDMKSQKELIDEFTVKKLQSLHSFQSFENQRREWELYLDKGNTFTHLSKQYPMKKKWAEELTLSR